MNNDVEPFIMETSLIFVVATFKFLFVCFLVVAFPPQVVQILSDSSGVPTAGSSHSVQCIARRINVLSPSTLLEIIWLDNSNNEIITPNSDISITGVTRSTDTNITSTLTFPNIRTSQAGRYTCAVNMTIPNVVDDHLVMKTTNVYVRSKFLRLFHKMLF